MTSEIAGSALQELRHNGLQRDAVINPQGIKNVLELRNRLGVSARMLTNQHKYYDSRYYDQAVKMTHHSLSAVSSSEDATK